MQEALEELQNEDPISKIYLRMKKTVKIIQIRKKLLTLILS